MYDYEKIFKRVISDIPLRKDNKVYGITFIAPQGTGKTTISRILSEKLNLYITSNDKIRRILEEFGIDPENESKLVNRLAEERTIYMLENKTSMIIDANMRLFYEIAMNNFNKYNSKLYFIRLQCSEEEILRRIDERSKTFAFDKENYSRASIENYEKYKKREKECYFPEDLVFFTIDTEKDINLQVEELVEKLKTDLGE